MKERAIRLKSPPVGGGMGKAVNVRAIIAALTTSILCLTGALAEEPPLAQVMEHIRADEWDAAYVAARPMGQVARDIVSWRRLRAGEGEFADYLDFLQRNSDWPGLDKIRWRGEAALTPHTRAMDVLAFFGEGAPKSGNGAYHLARALRQNGANELADQVLINAWRTIVMTTGEERHYLTEHGGLLRPFSAERMDMLLWRGETKEALDFLPQVDAATRKLAEARVALRRDRPGVDALITAVPKTLSDDPGLAYERFLWRMRRGRQADALTLFQDRSSSADRLGNPSRWAQERRSMARQLMRDDKAQAAYDLAASHYLQDGSSYADLEWLAGYIALQKLNDPKTALRHFRRFRASVSSPISLGRAGYWEGRAHEELGNYDEAHTAFAFGAEYQTSFYGLLAAERAGMVLDDDLVTAETFPDWKGAKFSQSSVAKAAQMFQEAGELNLAEWFLVHLAESLDRSELGQLGQMVLDLNEPHLAVRIAKRAARQGHVLVDIYFPDHPLAREELPAEPALALAIARRESEFDIGVTSPAGARGLMQLMPATARSMAKHVGVDYKPADLLTDWRYNALLGTAYLNKLTEEFDHNYVLVAAAYNAGPSRVRGWIERYGDPRKPDVDPIDWIEHIPFNETRNYVMRVMESLPVYRARLTGKSGRILLSQELRASPTGL